MSRPSRQALREASAWFARLGREDLGAGERAAFEAWRARPENAAAFSQVEALWDGEALPRVLTDSGAARRPPRRGGWFRMTAVAAGVLLAVAAFLWSGGMVAGLGADHATGAGERQRVVLADGTEVVLGTATALDVSLEESVREVRLLHGEAFFTVASDPARPFRVLTGDVAVRVTGTAFGVRQEEAGASVRVLEGAVEVFARDGDVSHADLTLSAGQGAHVSGKESAMLSGAAVAAGLAWLDGRLVFRDQPLSQVIAEIDRYHAGLIVIARPELAEKRVTGFFGISDPAGAVRVVADVVGADVGGIGDSILVLF